MEKCKLCGVVTYGSIGRAGIRWPFLCQKCKDKEDRTLLRKLDGQRLVISALSKKLNKGVMDGKQNKHTYSNVSEVRL